MGPFLVALLTAAGLVVSVAVAVRRPPPPLPSALLALGTPILTYLLYIRPFPGPLFAVLLIAGLVGGVVLQRRSVSWDLAWRRPDGLSLSLRIGWTAFFLWTQEAELAGGYEAFRTGLALFALAGGVWAGYLLTWHARQRTVALPDEPTPWSASHLIPAGGLPAWATADGSVAPQAQLAAGLEVLVATMRGDWAQVVCVNGWTGWVDGRRLVQRPPVRT